MVENELSIFALVPVLLYCYNFFFAKHVIVRQENACVKTGALDNVTGTSSGFVVFAVKQMKTSHVGRY